MEGVPRGKTPEGVREGRQSQGGWQVKVSWDLKHQSYWTVSIGQSGRPLR